MAHHTDAKYIPHLGIHVSKGKRKTLHDAMRTDIKDMKLGCVQIFTHGPQSAKMNDVDIPEIAKIATTTHVYIHSCYMASWKYLNIIHKELEVAEKIGAIGLVLHLPKLMPDKVCAPIPEMLKYVKKTKIILEMRALKPDADSYETPEKLIALIDELERLKITSDQVGICIDTAHIYAGLVNIRTYEDASKYIDKLQSKKEWFQLLHLNGNAFDSAVQARDKHCVPFSPEDFIWKGMEYKDSGFRAFIEWFHNKDIILELDFCDLRTINFYNDLVQRLNS